MPNCLDDRNHQPAVLRLNSGVMLASPTKTPSISRHSRRYRGELLAPITHRNFAL